MRGKRAVRLRQPLPPFPQCRWEARARPEGIPVLVTPLDLQAVQAHPSRLGVVCRGRGTRAEGELTVNSCKMSHGV